MATILVLFTTLSRAQWIVQQNPATSNLEALWSEPTEGASSAEIRFARLIGGQWTTSEVLSSDADPFDQPSLAFEVDGAEAAAWATDSYAIVLRRRPSQATSWSSGVPLSDTDEIAHSPSVAVYDGDVYVTYEVETGSGRAVQVAKMDPGNSVERSLVALTSSGSPLNVKIHAEGGLLWADWVASTEVMGFSVYIDGAWGHDQSEAYSGVDDQESARRRIKEAVLAN